MDEKEDTFNTYVKVDTQGNKEERYQEQRLLESGRVFRTESERCMGEWKKSL